MTDFESTKSTSLDEYLRLKNHQIYSRVSNRPGCVVLKLNGKLGSKNEEKLKNG